MNCGAQSEEIQNENEEYPNTDYWTIGEEISEEEANNRCLPIRPSPNGTQYIWLNDINPQ
jgi:hypothetical protein